MRTAIYCVALAIILSTTGGKEFSGLLPEAIWLFMFFILMDISELFIKSKH